MTLTVIEQTRYVLTGVEIVETLHASLRSDSLRGVQQQMQAVVVGGKQALLVDVEAENLCRRTFEQKFPDQVFVLGEESLRGFKVVQQTETVFVLVDMIDGTDLMEMDVPLWCSAMILLDPSVPAIIGAVVGLANGDIYYAIAGEPATYVQRATSGRRRNSERCPGPSAVTQLQSARVAFYGQKAGNLLSIVKSKNAIGFIDQIENQPFRIYNFAGNPIMLKLVDRLRSASGEVVGSGFDAVFELRGQKLHDMMPGAWLAKRAGAYLCDLNGDELTDEVLAQKLLRPNDTLPYVVASTEALAREICAELVENTGL